MLRELRRDHGTIKDKSDALGRLPRRHRRASPTTTRQLLERNGDRIIQLAAGRPADARAAGAVLARSTPACCRVVAQCDRSSERAFANGEMHITLEITKDRGKYVAGRDEPGLRRARRARLLAACRTPAVAGRPVPAATTGPAAQADPGCPPAPKGLAGTAEERGVVKPLVAAATGVPADQVPDVAVLLWGPLLRGTVVSTSMKTAGRP